MASITSTGLGSGLQINSLVQQLVDAERTPATSRLDKREASTQAKISAYGTFQSSLSDLRTSLASIRTGSVFSAMSATASDTSVIGASAFSTADAGTYKLDVSQLAQSHAIASQVSSDPSTVHLGTGTLTIDMGEYTGTPPTAFVPKNASKPALTLTIDTSNDTLNGIRDAINAKKAGVTAAVVNDGSGYKLVLNSDDAGVKNSLKVSGLAALTYDAAGTSNMTQTQAAQDAKLKINGLEVSSASNTITSALKGLSIKLLKTGSSSLTVGRDTSGASQALQGMVDKFNAVISFVKSQTAYDPAQQTAGAMIGDAALRGSMVQLRSLLSARDEDTGLGMTDLGVTTERDGTLKFNASKFTAALAANPAGVQGFLLGNFGASSGNALIVGATADNTAEEGTHSISVQQLARNQIIKSTLPVQDPKTTDVGTGTLTIDVGEYSGGTFTANDPAKQLSLTITAPNNTLDGIRDAINAASIKKEAGVTASVVGDAVAGYKLVLTSTNSGVKNGIRVAVTDNDGDSTDNSGLSAFAYDTSTGTTNMTALQTPQDAAFKLDGQDLTNASNTVTTALKGVTLNLLQTTPGATTVNLDVARNGSGGFGARMDALLNGMAGSGGTLSMRTAGLQRNLKDIQNARTKLATQMDALQARLLKQFNAMDRLVGSLQATGTALGQQLATLAGSSSSSSKN